MLSFEVWRIYWKLANIFSTSVLVVVVVAAVVAIVDFLHLNVWTLSLAFNRCAVILKYIFSHYSIEAADKINQCAFVFAASPVGFSNKKSQIEWIFFLSQKNIEISRSCKIDIKLRSHLRWCRRRRRLNSTFQTIGLYFVTVIKWNRFYPIGRTKKTKKKQI